MIDTTTDSEISTEHSDPTPLGVKLGSNRTVVVYRDREGQRQTVQTLTRRTASGDGVSDDNQSLLGQLTVQQHSGDSEPLLHSGLPTDARRAEQTETFFEQLCVEHDLPADSAVVYAIPAVDDECGLANFQTLVDQVSVGDALTRGFPESLCASVPALGASLEAINQQFVAINLGATTFEACAYRHGERLTSVSTPAPTGRDVDQAIVDAVADETDESVSLDRETARQYKETYADFDSFEPFTDSFERPDGRTDEITVKHGVMGPLDAYLDDIVEELTTGFFSRLATEQMKTYQLALSRPLVVTGGMACIPGLADELATRLGDELDRTVTAVTAKRPDVAAAEGAFRIADRLSSTD